MNVIYRKLLPTHNQFHQTNYKCTPSAHNLACWNYYQCPHQQIVQLDLLPTPPPANSPDGFTTNAPTGK